MTPNMPENTATPMAWRISEPAPELNTRGTTPMMKAIEVIRIGRRRRRQASSTAASGSRPLACLSLANSTIRIAFLHASPTSTIKPIWVKMLLSPPERITPVIAESRVIGTIRITASGRLQLSYWAASTRKASSTQSGKTNSAVLPDRICW
ncbi:hypothetical protein D9M73_204380 [compost metagenome]